MSSSSVLETSDNIPHSLAQSKITTNIRKSQADTSNGNIHSLYITRQQINAQRSYEALAVFCILALSQVVIPFHPTWSHFLFLNIAAHILHEGESIIIRTVGTRLVVGYTAGWTWQDTRGLLLVGHDKIHTVYCWLDMTRYTRSTPLLPLWCRCDLDSTFCAIDMNTPHLICTKKEQRAVIHFCGLKVYQLLICIEGCQCSMGTVSCYNGLSVNGSRDSKMFAQALSMGNEPDTNPHSLLMQTWNEFMVWSCRTLLKPLRN
jgi:hypothetical protein